MSEREQAAREPSWFVEEVDGGVLLVRLDVPDRDVNVLSGSSLRELGEVVDDLETRAARAVVFEGAKAEGETFVAGLDLPEVLEWRDPAAARALAASARAVFDRLERLPAATICAVHGNCFGVGMELALRCDVRLGSDAPCTLFGFPEIRVALLPAFGAGGRLAPLAGPRRALEILLAGETLDARQALADGVIDRLVYPAALREEAVALARRAIEKGGAARGRALGRLPARRRRRREGARGASRPAGSRLLQGVLRGLPRRPAPLGPALERFGRVALRTDAEAASIEARIFGDLATSSACRHLISLCLSEARARGGEDSAPAGGGVGVLRSEASARGFTRVGIVGAGEDAGSLVASLTRRRFRVRLQASSRDRIGKTLRAAHSELAASVRAGRLRRHAFEGALAAITTTTEADGFRRIPVVVDLDGAEREGAGDDGPAVAEGLDPRATVGVLLGGLPLSRSASSYPREERVVGLRIHPAVSGETVVEVVRRDETDPSAIDDALRLVRALGWIPVPVSDAPGQAVSRLLARYLGEALRLHEEGFSPPEIDEELRRFGMLLGPFELLDRIGLASWAALAAILEGELGGRMRVTEHLRVLLARPEARGSGRGAARDGFFYRSRGRLRRPCRPVIEAGGARGGPFRRAEPEAWTRRLLYPVVDEAARLLEEGVASSSAMIDLALVHAGGFAPARGGLLGHADELGLAAVVEALEAAGTARLEPSAALRERAASGRSFYAGEDEGKGPERPLSIDLPASEAVTREEGQ